MGNTPALQEVKVDQVRVDAPRGGRIRVAAVTYGGAALAFTLCPFDTLDATVLFEPKAFEGDPKAAKGITFDVSRDLVDAMLRLEAFVAPRNASWRSCVPQTLAPRIRAKLPRDVEFWSKDGDRLNGLPRPWRAHRANAVIEVKWLYISPSGEAGLTLHVKHLQLDEEV
jgi:hypothetical protein